MGKYAIDKIMLRTQAADVVERYILENDLKEGDRLPSEREFAKMLNIGRNTLREGLRKLELEGIIEIRSGSGTYVTGNVGNIINMQISVDRLNFIEWLEVRRILEHGIMDLAIDKATKKDLNEIERRLNTFLDTLSGEDVSIMEAADAKFHHAIYRATHNRMLYELIHPMANVFHDLWDPNEITTTEGLMYKALCRTAPYHTKLYKAILKGDNKTARETIDKILDIDISLCSVWI